MKPELIGEMVHLIQDVENKFKTYAKLASNKKTPQAKLKSSYEGFITASEKMIRFRDENKPEY
jgi:hypothetical protein